MYKKYRNVSLNPTTVLRDSVAVQLYLTKITSAQGVSLQP